MRNAKIDFTRGVAILLVVLGHVIQSCLSINETNFLSTLIQTVQMPLLMFISGYCAAFSLPIYDARKFIIKKTKTIFLPYISWAYLYYFISCIVKVNNPLSMNMFKTFTLSGFWFLRVLYVIFIIWTIYNVVLKIVGDGIIKDTIILGVLIILAFVLGKFKVLGLVGLYKHTFFFFMGTFCNKYKNICIKLFRRVGISTSILYIMGIVGLYYINLNTLIYTIIDHSMAITGIFFVCFISNFIYSISNRKIRMRIIDIGNKTLGIYAIHWCLLFASGIIDYSLIIKTYNINFQLAVSFIFLMWVILSLIFYEIIYKSKLMRFIFLGKK